MTFNIALVSDDPGWHGARLQAAFAERDCELVVVSLADCGLAAGDARPGPILPGFEHRLPDGVFVRGISGGTLEEVILRLDVLHGLQLLGVPVYNSGRAIERSVDKGMTSLLLSRAGVRTPPTWVVANPDLARDILRRECAAGHQLVMKPLFGSQGKGVVRVGGTDDLPDVAAYNGVYYMQRYIEGCGYDWRVFVINGRAVAAMKRHGGGWIHNVAQGARCSTERAEGELATIAEAAVAALGMDYAGVDLILDESGVFSVLEVNGIPAWKGLQETTETDMAHALVDDFCSRYLLNGGLRVISA